MQTNRAPAPETAAPSAAAREALEPLPVPAGEPMTSVPVEVTLRESWAQGARVVPGIHVAVGLAASRTELAHPPAERPALLTLRSDTTGVARGELSLPAARVAAPLEAVIWAEVREPGYSFTVSTTSLAKRRPILLVPRAGGTVYALVRGPNREPVARARAQLLVARPEGFDVLAGENTNDEGRCVLHAAAQAPFLLQARAEGVGFGVRRELAFAADGAALKLELALDGPGILTGRVLDPQGAPVSSLALYAAPAATDERNAFLRPHDHELGGGLWSAHTTTDAQGRFRFAGMIEGAFVIRDGSGAALHAGTLLTGSAEIGLCVARHRLRVIVLDRDGKPVESAGQGTDGAVRVLCTSAEPDSGSPWQTRSTAGIPEGGGSVLFFLPAEASYHVEVVSPGAALVAERVDLPANPCLIECELRLGAPLAPGTLKIVAHPRAGCTTEWQPEISVRSPASDAVLWPERDAWSGSFTLAPGRYVVRAEVRPFAMCGDGLSEPLVADLSPAEQEVEVRSGVEQEVELELAGSGRLELELELNKGGTEVRLSDESFQELFAGEGSFHERELRIRRRIGAARVELVAHDGSRRIEPWFFPVEKERLIKIPFALPGRPCRTTTPIPPGEYAVHVTLADGRTLEATASIEHGRTTKLALASER